jgi:succinate dehydrogenase/fumarate reductase-like Fe-S protein
MVSPRRWRALVFLGIQAVFVHPWRLLFRPRSARGKPRFLTNYGPERLLPVSPADREAMPAFMRCIGCGLCDVVCPLVGKLDRRRFQGPSVVALAYTRATPDLKHVAATLAHLPADCGACTLCVDTCPTRVPLRDLFAYGNRQLQAIDERELGRVA